MLKAVLSLFVATLILPLVSFAQSEELATQGAVEASAEAVAPEASTSDESIPLSVAAPEIIYDSMIYNDDGSYSISYSIAHYRAVTGQLQVWVDLGVVDEEGFISYVHSAPLTTDLYSVGIENSPVVATQSFVPPTYLEGDYNVFLSLRTARGTKVHVVPAGVMQLSNATAQPSTPLECTWSTPESSAVSARERMTITPFGLVQFVCSNTNEVDFTLRFGGAYGAVLPSEVSTTEVDEAPGAVALSFAAPAAPGVYGFEISSSQQKPVIGEFIVAGEYVNILNASLNYTDEGPYSVAFEYDTNLQNEAFPLVANLTLVGKDNECTYELKMDLTSYNRFEEFFLPKLGACVPATVDVTISNDTGLSSVFSLTQKTAAEPAVESLQAEASGNSLADLVEPHNNSQQVWLLAVIVILAVLAVTGIATRTRCEGSSEERMKKLLLFVLVLGGLGMCGSVEAQALNRTITLTKTTQPRITVVVSGPPSTIVANSSFLGRAVVTANGMTFANVSAQFGYGQGVGGSGNESGNLVTTPGEEWDSSPSSFERVLFAPNTTGAHSFCPGASAPLHTSSGATCINYTVTAASAPTVNAGIDRNIVLPTNSVVPQGASVSSGATCAWTKVSGPTGGTITSGTSCTAPTFTSLVEGTYVFQLTATNGGLSASDTMSVRVDPDIPPDLTGGNCPIAVGASTCSITIYWAVNGPTPWEIVHNSSNYITLSTRGGNMPYTVSHGTQNFSLTSDSNVLDSFSINVTCASGSSWNGSICAAVATPTYTLTVTPCTVPAGASSCSVAITWDATGTQGPWELYRNKGTGTCYDLAYTDCRIPGGGSVSSQIRGNTSAAFAPGSHRLSLDADSTNIANTSSFNISCASGSSWNGTTCAASATPTIPATPAMPTSATPGSCGTGAVSVAWTSVSGATGYDLQYRTGAGTWTTLTSVTSPRNVTGLTAGASYEFQVRAKNSAGSSAWSPSRTATAPSVCDIPTTTIFNAPSSCTIASGANSCNVTLSWDLTGHPSPSIRNNSTAVTVSTAVTSAGQSVSLPYRSTAYSFEARSSITTLLGTTRNITTNCASGTSWNGSTCAATTPPPPTTSFTAPTSCTIPLGGNTCTVNVSWNLTGQTSPNITNAVTNATLYTSVTGTNQPVTLPYRSVVTTLHARSGTTLLIPRDIATTCTAGAAWDGDSCETLPPPPPPPPPAPVVSMTVIPSPQFVRSGETTKVEIVVDSTATLNCTHTGIQSTSGTFTHSPLLGNRSTRNITSRVLTSAQRVNVSCTDPISGAVTTADAVVNVVPLLEEI